jgi:hypothetical protein
MEKQSLPVAGNKKVILKMKTLKKMLVKLFAQKCVYARSSDIKGRKSGGARDGNGVDWRNTGGVDQVS